MWLNKLTIGTCISSLTNLTLYSRYNPIWVVALSRVDHIALHSYGYVG